MKNERTGEEMCGEETTRVRLGGGESVLVCQDKKGHEGPHGAGLYQWPQTSKDAREGRMNDERHDTPIGKYVLAVVDEVVDERIRQEKLRAAGKFLHSCATWPGLTEPEKLAVLAEEFGEVAKEVTELGILRNKFKAAWPTTVLEFKTDDELKVFEDKYALAQRAHHDEYAVLRNKIRKELIQVAAVCCAWVEAIDAEVAESAESTS